VGARGSTPRAGDAYGLTFATPEYLTRHWADEHFELVARQGEPSVRSLFAVDPFGDDPPAFVRACVFRYRFADPEGRARGLLRERELVRELTVAPVEVRLARGSGFVR